MCVLRTEPIILVFDFLFTPAPHHGLDVHLFPHCFLQTSLLPSTSCWPALLKLTMSDCGQHHYPLMLSDVSIPELMFVTSVSARMDDSSSSQLPRGPNLLTSLAPHERLPEILVVPREKTPTGAAARGNPWDMDRGAWWDIVHGATKSQTWPSNWAYTYGNDKLGPRGSWDEEESSILADTEVTNISSG